MNTKKKRTDSVEIVKIACSSVNMENVEIMNSYLRDTFGFMNVRCDSIFDYSESKVKYIGTNVIHYMDDEEINDAVNFLKSKMN